MKQKPRNLVLYALSLLCCTLTFFPLWQLFSAYTGVTDNFQQARIYACFVTAGMIAAVLRVVLSIKAKRRKIKILHISLLLAALAVGIWRFWLLTPSLMTLAALIGTFVFLLIRCGKEPADLFDTHVFVFFLTIQSIGLLILCKAFPDTNPLSWGCGITIAESILFFFLRNQYTLQRFISRRTHENAEIPKEIRRGNLLLLTGTLAFCGLGFFLRKPILALLRGAKLAAVQVFRAFVFLFQQIVPLLNTPNPTEKLPNEPMNSDLPTADSNPLWGLLWLIVIPTCFFLLRSLFSGVLHDVMLEIAQFFANLRKKRPQHSFVGSDDFTDTVTICAADHSEQSAAKLRRDWLKQYKQWCKSPASDDKFYVGYHLLETAPVWMDEMPRSSDTIAQISRKWDDSLANTLGCDLHTVTDGYHAERFGGMVRPAQALDDLSDALRAAAKSKLRKE